MVRRRALAALGAVRSDIAQQWIPHIRRMLGDGDAGVRAAAHRRAVVDQPGRRGVVRAPAPRRSRSAHPRDGGGGHGRQLASRGRRSRRSDAARSHERHRGFGQGRAPRRRGRHPPDRRSAFPPSAHSALVRSGAGRRRRGHGERPGGECKRRRLHVRADARLAAQEPPAQGPRPRRARRLRRARRRLARVLSARSGRGHLGAPPHSRDARADPVAEDDGRPRRRARGAGRVHPLQGGVGARAAAPRAPRAHAHRRVDREARGSGSAPLLQFPVAARQPVRQGEARRPTRCSRRGSPSR